MCRAVGVVLVPLDATERVQFGINQCSRQRESLRFKAVVAMATVSDSSSSGQLVEGDNGGEQQTISPSLAPWLPEPQDVTDWLVEYRLNGSAPCPLGFVCDDERVANCTKIRAVALTYGFGDVHAGAYCPEGKDGLQVCPAGSFCPTAEIQIPCPEGFYCPYKTFIPSIPCSKCSEGAAELVRERYGYFLVGAMFLLALIWIVLGRLGNYRSNLVAHFVDLSSRSLDSARSLYQRNQRTKELERLKPKLFAIQQRLELLQYGSDNGITASNTTTATTSSSKSKSSNAGLSILDSGKIYYNAGQLFDALDKDKNAKLDFEELQDVLELNPEQLQAFVTRMNELAGQRSNATNVSRAVFVKNFLRVLEETSNFGPTQAEVEELFDELSYGNDFATYLDFFDSRLSMFLSDPQINNMIAEFRKCASLEDTTKSRPRSSVRRQRNSADVAELQAGSSLVMAEEGTKRPNLGLAASSRKFSVANLFAPQDGKDAKRIIYRDVFCKYYTEVLARVTQEYIPDANAEDSVAKAKGVDLAFENLSLAVSLGDKEVNVVNEVSGRLAASTMTALMGGSGAGKTSLLNALCGRAFYGTTKGTIRINGHVTTIEEHKSSTGFVPQDDIVHAELTVRENLIYSGRFSLAKGTPIQEIEDYADTVLAYLGLSRVADSIVGDVNRRGVSGGEKKRVNIGVELMSKPSILFLDEPTSGLDSSSALLVMGSLKKLVQSQGVTVLSVIHQPRKAIFDSFDSLILLGVGGNMVYHGPVSTAQEYFATLPHPYLLPAGESLADWLIDVSSGSVVPNESKGE